MFGEDDPGKKVIDEFTANGPDGQLTGLSTAFTAKHFATGDPDARQKGEDRYNVDNDMVVSTFLYPNDALAFSNEVHNCVPFFKALLARIQSKAASYRARNKRVDDLVIRSSAQYTKVQCTQSKSFIPYSTLEYMYYGIATPGGEPICDHYVKKSQVFSGQTLSLGWKKLDLAKVSVQPPVAIEVYTKYGTFD